MFKTYYPRRYYEQRTKSKIRVEAQRFIMEKCLIYYKDFKYNCLVQKAVLIMENGLVVIKFKKQINEKKNSCLGDGDV